MTRYPLGNYGLAVVLGALWLGSWVAHLWTGWQTFVADQAMHGVAAHWTGPDGYLWQFGEQTFENWQSEFLQLLTMVVLTATLIFRGSSESKEGMERLEAKVDALARANGVRLDVLDRPMQDVILVEPEA